MSREWNGSCEDWLHGDEHLSDSCDSEFEEGISHTVHLKSISLYQHEYDRLIELGFRDWILEQAELRNIEYDYLDKEEKCNEQSN